jgi:hypothetical protein
MARSKYDELPAEDAPYGLCPYCLERLELDAMEVIVVCPGCGISFGKMEAGYCCCAQCQEAMRDGLLF